MKAIGIFLLVAILLGAGFAGGLAFMRWRGAQDAAAVSERKVLYWVDPMHPAYKSDKPGVAPDCGMKLEPVYADGGAAPAPAGANSKPTSIDDLSKMEVGTVQITPEKQQLIGMKYEHVELGGGSRTIRAA